MCLGGLLGHVHLKTFIFNYVKGRSGPKQAHDVQYISASNFHHCSTCSAIHNGFDHRQIASLLFC